uniref:Uncharacterized protein n=1 Tax=Oryza meridionalis TaxID=40149 RepID=A0A0E0D7E2_9ORYZ
MEVTGGWSRSVLITRQQLWKITVQKLAILARQGMEPWTIWGGPDDGDKQSDKPSLARKRACVHALHVCMANANASIGEARLGWLGGEMGREIS